MSFEVLHKDVLGRIGRLETKSGVLETPYMYPVINPAVQPISPREMYEELSFNAVMTNAYLLYRRLREAPERPDIHELLNYPGIVATDSGAYQLLRYRAVMVDPLEIVAFQESINSDIAVILDVPTGYRVSREKAEWTVKETLRRADESLKAMKRADILWVAPIQGGVHLDLLATAASEMGKKPYAICALGSPTEVMGRYSYAELVDMILTAKMKIPPSKPLHLFGAGHPMIMSLAVALGCDIFDSAAYALYAKGLRYMTPTGTLRLESLRHFPCSCPQCSSHTPEEVRRWFKHEVVSFLAKHNLYVCMAELKAIKQAIAEGRLWEFVRSRAHAHPALTAALRRLRDYRDFIEKHSPSTKPKGIFYYDSLDLSRPEVVSHSKRIVSAYVPPEDGRILLLVPNHVESKVAQGRLTEALNALARVRALYVCFYGIPYGVIPVDLKEVFPLAQTEVALPTDAETLEGASDILKAYLSRAKYSRIVFYTLGEGWEARFLKACKALKRKPLVFKPRPEEGGEQIAKRLLKELKIRLKKAAY